MSIGQALLPIFGRRVYFFHLRTGFARDIRIDHLPHETLSAIERETFA